MTPRLPARTAPVGLDTINAVALDIPRAVVICVKVARVAATIDPDADFGPDGWLLHLSTLNVKGADIVTLHDKVCEGDVVLLLALLRAVQIGHIKASDLRIWIYQARPLDTFEACCLLEAVRRDLPRFWRGAAPS